MKIIVVALIVAGLLLPLLWSFLPPPLLAFAVIAIVVGIVLVGTSGRRQGDGTAASTFLVRSGFLCDRCKYNDPRDCSRHERPNATRCPDFRSR